MSCHQQINNKLALVRENLNKDKDKINMEAISQGTHQMLLQLLFWLFFILVAF